MQATRLLEQKLSAINGNDYGAYQSLLGTYDFPLFRLVIQQIPKDPYAPPHTGVYRLQVQRDDERIIHRKLDARIRRIAFTDFLARQFFNASKQVAGNVRGTGNSGIITINEPGQAILDRNSVVVTDKQIEVRCFVGLPAKGRDIDSELARQMLLEELPEIVDVSLLSDNIDPVALDKHINVAEDAEYLRGELDSHGLVAFIANDSLLPRESGTSDKPLQKEAIPFIAPESWSREVVLPNAGKVKGMGIPRGITLVTGGGYHGKSTLLQALEAGIYNHVPGDGRELVVTVGQATKIRAYSGRYVINTDISPFIRNLPFGKDTTAFSTVNASGSTSQAANIIEALEAGTDVLLMDEDTCATNFMIRDHKMQQLVDKKDEPITTFIDKVRQLKQEQGVSTILVLGGVGDYFDVSDQVVQMINYQPVDVTAKAQQIATESPTRRKPEDEGYPFLVRARAPIAGSVSPLSEYGKFRLFAKEVNRLHFGEQVIDLTDLEQLIELSQTKAIGYAMEYARRYMDGDTSLREVVQRVVADMNELGMDVISDRVSGHFAGFRALELAFALNRLRGFEVNQVAG